MTREEFSVRLRELRDESGVILKNMCISMEVLPRDISRIEKALHNYTLDRAIQYLNAVGAQLLIEVPNGTTNDIDSSEKLSAIFKDLRGNLSYRALSEKTAVSFNAVRNIEVGSSALSIDIFLKLSEYYNLKVILRKKP